MDDIFNLLFLKLYVFNTKCIKNESCCATRYSAMVCGLKTAMVLMKHWDGFVTQTCQLCITCQEFKVLIVEEF